jgi:hypothetical protein
MVLAQVAPFGGARARVSYRSAVVVDQVTSPDLTSSWPKRVNTGEAKERSERKPRESTHAAAQTEMAGGWPCWRTSNRTSEMR